ncbi:hypothetical protein FZC33_32885 [Labrys sp. KNU-23]|uniref:hypothetical protein n=1 Tax=Labrys sp. KNU-23 TaxID=2789216 RepID=UPI0011F025D8|nr:hypothetical protein [Labrys sp. KNU-23]QEN90800.1 hypothetical protein FZC33_32885 [Labrys sp. KNU-23]
MRRLTPFSTIILAGLLLQPSHIAAQTDASPTLQAAQSGTTRCVSVRDSGSSNENGGALVGCINPTTGAFELPLNLRNQADIDEHVLRSYGFRGDGGSHPLSSVTNLNGRNTAGWSLAQWQAILPAARALSDEIDGAAINSLIQMNSGALKFRLGPLTARFSTPSPLPAARAFVSRGLGLNSPYFGSVPAMAGIIAGSAPRKETSLNFRASSSSPTTPPQRTPSGSTPDLPPASTEPIPTSPSTISTAAWS